MPIPVSVPMRVCRKSSGKGEGGRERRLLRGRGGGGGGVGEREGVVVRDGLELEGVLLRVVRGEELVEDGEGAVAVARGEDEALAVGGPASCTRACERSRSPLREQRTERTERKGGRLTSSYP